MPHRQPTGGQLGEVTKALRLADAAYQKSSALFFVREQLQERSIVLHPFTPRGAERTDHRAQVSTAQTTGSRGRRLTQVIEAACPAFLGSSKNGLRS